MFRVSLRNLLASKLRLLLTIAAVTVGVTFVSGTFVLSDTMNKAFDQLFSGLTAGTDVVVRGRVAYTTDVTAGEQPPPLRPGDLLPRELREPGARLLPAGAVRLRNRRAGGVPCFRPPRRTHRLFW